jgi:hypothetical protein
MKLPMQPPAPTSFARGVLPWLIVVIATQACASHVAPEASPSDAAAPDASLDDASRSEATVADATAAVDTAPIDRPSPEDAAVADVAPDKPALRHKVP